MIDCHNHMLPGIDDGAHDVNYALAMAKIAVEAGITEVIVTPHHLNGVFTNSREEILKSVMGFRFHLAKKNIPLKIHPGSELHIVPELIPALQDNQAMTYGDKRKAVLLEFPKHIIPNGSEQLLENIMYLGLTPIIAHPERNSTIRRKPELIENWVKEGCRMQLTTQSVSGQFGREIQALCKSWCKRGLIHLIASDAHRAEGRSPDMRAGANTLEKWLSKSAMEIMTKVNPQKLILGESLMHIKKESPSKRNFLKFMNRRHK